MSLPVHMSVKFCPKCGRERDKYTSERCYPDTNVVVVWCHGCGQKWCEDTHASTPPIEQGETKSVRVTVLPDSKNVVGFPLNIEGHRVGSSIGGLVGIDLGMHTGQTGAISWTPDKKPEPVYAAEKRQTRWVCSACGCVIPPRAPIGTGFDCPHCGRTFNADPKYEAA